MHCIYNFAFDVPTVEPNTCLVCNLILFRSQQTFSVKSQVVNILGFVKHTVSLTTTEHCPCSMKAVIDTTYVNGHGCPVS